MLKTPAETTGIPKSSVSTGVSELFACEEEQGWILPIRQLSREYQGRLPCIDSLFASVHVASGPRRGGPRGHTLAIKYKDPRKLKPRAKTPRTHTPRQIKQIATSIQEFGFINPVLIDGSDGIVAGHARVEAAISLGMT